MDTSQAKIRLQEELHAIEGALSELGPRNPQTGEWEASAGEIDPTATESDEIADRLEETEARQDALAVLGDRRADVLLALKTIDDGTYGTCATCSAPIEAERLSINPAAHTCAAHA